MFFNTCVGVTFFYRAPPVAASIVFHFKVDPIKELGVKTNNILNLFNLHYCRTPKAATGGVLWKKEFLEISQNSQENTCARFSFLIKLQASDLQLYFKKRLWHRCFPVTFVKFLSTPFYRTPLDDCFEGSMNFLVFTEKKWVVRAPP